jgi:hypothetical protein
LNKSPKPEQTKLQIKIQNSQENPFSNPRTTKYFCFKLNPSAQKLRKHFQSDGFALPANFGKPITLITCVLPQAVKQGRKTLKILQNDEYSAPVFKICRRQTRQLIIKE